ncbi:hypothetical protein O6H91_12G004100 [Diphasiastrum complanatum]|nr:hypothetical protein O6H91_12G004100 [Diphasiastrum complanatum]
MGVEIARCLLLRPLVSGLTRPWALQLPKEVAASRGNADLKGGLSGSESILRKNALHLSWNRGGTRDSSFFRRRLVHMDCRTEASDGYWKDGLGTSDNISRFSSESCGDRTKDASQNSVISKGFSLHEKEGSTKVPALAEGVSIPSSLRKLKKQQGQKRLQEAEDSAENLTCSISNAFSSMVFIIRSLQNYTLQMRQVIYVQNDVQGISAMMQREMQCSFVWLFQQVFASTPKLMVSVMIFLTNFTVFSVGNSIIPENTSSTELPHAIQYLLHKDSQKKSENNLEAVFGKVSARSKFETLSSGSTKHLDSCEQIDISLSGVGSGRNIVKSFLVAGGSDEGGKFWLHPHRRAMSSEEESNPPELHSSRHGAAQEDALLTADKAMMKSKPFQEHDPTLESTTGKNAATVGALKSSTPEVQRGSQENLIQPHLNNAAKDLRLSSEDAFEDMSLKGIFVAPVTANLESDRYECYDRTDLTYQHALSLDCENPLLLANYAQFLYVVRHDHDR